MQEYKDQYWRMQEIVQASEKAVIFTQRKVDELFVIAYFKFRTNIFFFLTKSGNVN